VRVETSRQSLSRLLALGFERQPQPAPAIDPVQVDGGGYRLAAARPAMGTLVTITVLSRSRDRGETAIGRAFEEMDRLIAILSRFESASALSQLNSDGRLTGPPPELVRVVSRALHYHSVTGGVFDISVAPVLDLFAGRLGVGAAGPPPEADLRDALQRVGATRISASRREVRFERDGMGVTVDGIAKGFIADCMAAVLEGHRIRRYLIDAGGDLRASGRKEGDQPWTVAVRDPRGRDVLPDRLELRRGAVATSGSYERFFDPERRYHHIVQADAGRSPTDCVSVTALAPTAMAADALATSLFIMSPGRALAFAGSLPGCECLIVDRSGRTLRSRGWRSVAPTHVAEENLQ
jgi:FAD:protein FMN transferase